MRFKKAFISVLFSVLLVVQLIPASVGTAFADPDDVGSPAIVTEGPATEPVETEPAAPQEEPAPDDGEEQGAEEQEPQQDADAGVADQGTATDAPQLLPIEAPVFDAPGDVAATGADGLAQGWTWRLVEQADGNYTLTFASDGSESADPSFIVPDNFTSNIAGQLADYIDKITGLDVPEGATGIGKAAFSQLTSLETASIGSTVATIGDQAFGNDVTGGGTTNLSSVTFKTSTDGEGNEFSALTAIGKGAFAGTALESLDLSKTRLSTIPENLCRGCSELASVTLPSTVAGQMGRAAFRDCPALSSINLEDTSLTHVGVEGFYGSTGLTAISFPATLTNINADAFNGCTSLSSVSFADPADLRVIRDRAFYGCTSLESVTLPDSMTSIGGSVFYNCSNLKSVDMPALRYFNSGLGNETYLFANCPALEELTFRPVEDKQGYTTNNTLPNYALSGDTSLKKLDLSGWSDWDNTFTLGNVFVGSDGSSLEEIILPTNTAVSLGGGSFANKTGFDDLGAIKNPQSVTNVAANAFKGSGVTNADLTNWTGITAINQETFANCSNLTSATIPANVTTLGKMAFANDPSLTDFRVDSTRLTGVQKDVFDGTGRLETVTIGAGVEEITADFFVATPSQATVKFEGESIIKVTKATLSGGESPLKDLDGTYWVSPEGVLYELKDDGTAALAYVPDGITSYTVPQTITAAPDADHPGGTYSVTRMNPHAVHMADSLTSLTFAKPDQVVIAPSAFTGRSTSSNANGLSVNGDTKINPADFASASVLCDYPLDEESNMHLVPAVESSIVNADGKVTSKTTIAINNKLTGTTDDEGNPVEDGIYHYKTGEKATYTIAISNQDNTVMQDVVRVYFAYDSPGQQMGAFPVRDDPYNLVNPATGDQYPCKVVETDTPGIYYYEIEGIKPGQTLAFQNDVFYPSPNTPGGTLRIWTDTLTHEEAAQLAGKLIDPTDYVQLEWETTPVTYDIVKERSPQSATDSRSASIRVNEAGEARVANITYRIYEQNQGSSALTEGLDYIRWVQYEDIIDLPDELSWRSEVIAAVNAGPSDGTAGDGWWIVNSSTNVDPRDYSYARDSRLINVRAGGKTYNLAHLAFSDGTAPANILGLTPTIVTVDGKQKLKLTWYVNNSALDSTGSATNEYPTRRFFLRVCDDVVLADVDAVSELFENNPGATESPLKVGNTITEERHYSYSEDQTASDDAEVPVSANAGLEVSKSWNNTSEDVYGATPDAATVTITNTGIMQVSQWGSRIPELDENGNVKKDEQGNTVYEQDELGRDKTDGQVMTDTLPATHFITGTDMVSMLNAVETAGTGNNSQEVPVGDWLTITINAASLFTPDQFQPSEGTSQNNKYVYGSASNISATGDNGYRTYQGAKFVITKDDEGHPTVTLSGDPIEANNKTYVIAEDGDYATIDELFKAVGYMPTAGTTYSLNYTADDFTLKAGQRLRIRVLSTTKSTPMLLTGDAESYRGDITYNYNTANVKANVGGSYVTRSASTSRRDWNSELFLYKAGYVNGTSVSGSPAMVDDGTVVDYDLYGTNYGRLPYETQSMHDTMAGATVLLVPVAQNPNLKAPDGSALDTYVSGGVTYWLLNKVGTYSNVVVGSTTRGGTQSYVAQTITVSETTSGGTRTSLDTTVHWTPFKNWGVGSGGSYTTHIFYKALISAGESGLAPEGGGDEAKKYEVWNKGWLGDHQGHRLYDTCWYEYQIYRTNKKILTESGSLVEYSRLNHGNTVTYQMEVINHATVPARLTGNYIRDALPDTCGVFAWTGGKNGGSTANVTNLRYIGSDGVTVTVGSGADAVQLNVDGSPNDNNTYWDVVSSTQPQFAHTEASPNGASLTRKGGYDIVWDDNFSINFPENGTCKILVDVTFPERPEEGASLWDQYVAKVRGGYLYNTFYVDTLWDDVSHTLAATGKAVLYKGVYDTGTTTHGGAVTSERYTSHKSRIMYSNGIIPTTYSVPDLKAETVAYYTVLYNGSYDRMYLSDLQDQLPRGFHFNSMNNTAAATTTLYYNSGVYGNITNKNSSTSSSNYIGYTGNQLYFGTGGTYTVYQGFTEGFNSNRPWSPDYQNYNDYRTVYMDNSGDEADENTVKYVNARITATVTDGEDGREHITFTPSQAGSNGGYYPGLHYDSVVGKYYLNPGEALRFGYNVMIDEYAQTDDFATNTIAMPYYDYYGMDFTLDVPDENGEGGAVQKTRPASGILNNDGGCELMTDTAVASQFGMNTANYQDDRYKSHEGGNWLVSDVTLERAPIVPGMQKVVGGITPKVLNATDATIQGSRYNDAALYGTPYSGGAKTADIINWRLRAFNEEGAGNDNVVSQMYNYTLTDTVAAPFSFCGQVFYNMYAADGANGVRVTPTSTALFTIGSRTEGDTSARIGVGASPNASGYRYVNIGSAEDDSDDDWFQFGSGNREGFVKIERNANGEEVMTIQFVGLGYAVPAGHWNDVCVHTMFMADQVIISEGRYNDVVLTTEQDYDPAAVAQGRARTKQEYDPHGNLITVNDGVQSGASVMLTQGYTTSSWKTVTEYLPDGRLDTAHMARSDGAPTYITLSEKSDSFKYDLYVEGPAAVMSKIVLIDDLPQPGDHSSFVEADKRNSDFIVNFLAEDPDFRVALKPKGGTERVLEPDQYRLYVNTKTEFDSADWDGEGEGWIDITEMDAEERTSVLEEARSLRVVIIDPDAFTQKKDFSSYMMASQCQIHISFNGRIVDAEAVPGQIAWNSFGYRYQVPLTFNGTEQDSTAISLEAQPLNVGVKYPAAPRLEKQLATLTQAEEPVTETIVVEETEQAVDEDGNPLYDEDGNPVMVPKMVPVLDEEGNPVYDEDGNPVMEQATHTETHVVTEPVEYPIYDSEGNPVLDEDGNQVVEIVDEPVMQPAFEPVLDVDGNPVLDENGEVIMQPVLEMTPHPALEDLQFRFIVYKGDALPALDNALNMTNAEVAAALESAGRDYLYIPLDIPAGETSAQAKLWLNDYTSTYDEETDSFITIDTDEEGNKLEPNWHWENTAKYTVVELSMGEYNYSLTSFMVGRTIHQNKNNIPFGNSNMTVTQLVAANEWLPEYVNLEVEKVWDDDSDRDAVRPESITLHLLADGEEIETREVTAADGWKTSFDGLLVKHETGGEIVYQVTEDAVDNYSTTIKKGVDGKYGLVITNTHTPDKTSLTVTKTWDDGNNADDIRPSSVTVRLLANGVDTGQTITISAAGNWTGTFTDIPINQNGEPIEYTVAEDPVSGYTATITGDAVKGYKISNKHEPTGKSNKNKRLPGTGDETPIAPYLLVIGLGAAAIVGSRRLGYHPKH